VGKKKPVEKKELNQTLEIILTLLAIFLGFFFALSPVHDWAADLPFHLHFCNHQACIFYSIIWFTFAIIGAYHLNEIHKNKTNKKLNKTATKRKSEHKKISPTWGAAYLIVLAVGLLLMNMTYCDESGKMYFSADSGSSSANGSGGDAASTHSGSGSDDGGGIGGGSGGGGCSEECEDYATEIGASNYRDDIATADDCYDAAVADCGADPSLFSWGLPGEELLDLDSFLEGYVVWDNGGEDELVYCCAWNCGDPETPCEDSVLTGCDGHCDKGKCIANKTGGCTCGYDSGSALTCPEICEDWGRDKGIIIWNEIYDDAELCIAAGGEVADIADEGDFDMACCCIDLAGENYVETEDAWCVDSDGGVYFDVYGICMDSTSYVTADECIYVHPDTSIKKLHEKKCADDGHCCAAEIHTCEEGVCADNVCPPWGEE